MGMGGGTILILCLSLFLGKDQHIAQGTNLIFFVPTSIISILTNLKEKLIKWKTGLIIIASGIIGALVRSKNISWLRYKIFKDVFWNIFTNYCRSRNFDIF